MLADKATQTQSCVPLAYRVPLLAPAYDDKLCPHWAERWEVRTRPLGCQVSTITALAVLGAVGATLLVVLLAWLVAISVRRLRRAQLQPGWWKVWRYRLPNVVRLPTTWWRDRRKRTGPEQQEHEREREQEPLLGP